MGAHADAVTRRGTLVVALARDRAELDRFARRTTRHRRARRRGDRRARARSRRPLHAAACSSPTRRISTRARRWRPWRERARRARRSRSSAVEAAPRPAGTVIDCRGLAARDALPDLRGVKGEMLVLRCPDITLSRPVRLLHPRIPLYIVPRGDGIFMLGATMIESAERGRVTARSLLELLSAAYALHPAFGEAEVVEIGADAAPGLPRQPAAHPPPRRASSTSTASSATASCWPRPWRGMAADCRARSGHQDRRCMR